MKLIARIQNNSVHRRIAGYISNFRNLNISFALDRLMAIVLLTALLTPIFLFRDTPSATAAINISLMSVKPPLALVSNPPAPYNISSSTTLPTAALSSLTSLNSFLASGYASVVGFFSPPQLPEGFEMAKPVSPFAVFVSSISLSIAAFLGFGSSSSSKKPANNTASLNMTLAQPAGSVSFDFDGDGKADLARWRSASGDWQIKNSQNGVTSTFALGSGAGNRIAPADYDGDGRTDAATFTAATGTWTIKRSSDSVTQT